MRRFLVWAVVGAIVGWTATMIYLAVRPQVLVRDDDRLVRVGLGQKHFLISTHSRRQPSWQLTWNAPDGATGYTVYVSTPCPSPTCQAPTCVVGDASVSQCGNCPAGTDGSYIADGGYCRCLDDFGKPVCVGGSIQKSDIVDAGGCSSPALCCVTYPGAPAPAGKHDGIVVSQCYQTLTPTGAPIQTDDGGRCCAHGTCWYPYPNFARDGGIGTPDGKAPYIGTCWEALNIERPCVFDVEAH